MENSISPQQLSQAWLEAKATEGEAKSRRIEIEKAIVARLGAQEEGSETHDLGEYKVTVTGVINRTLDKEIWESIKAKIAEERRPVVYEPKLDVTGVKWLQKNDPDSYRILAQALTIKPGKTNIKVTVINEEIK